MLTKAKLAAKIQPKLWARVALGISWTVVWWTSHRAKKLFYRYAPRIYAYVYGKRRLLVLIAAVYALWRWPQWKPWVKQLDYSWIPAITAGQAFFLAGAALALLAIRALFQTAMVHLQLLPSRMQMAIPPIASRATQSVPAAASAGQAFPYDEERQAQIEEIQKLYSDGILKDDMPLEEVMERAFGVEAE